MSDQGKRAVRAALLWTGAAAGAITLAGCSKEEPAPAPAPSQTASAVQAPAAPPAASSAPTVAASASASGPVHDCPKGTVGDGTFSKPCDAKGASRMMEVAWTGKMDDKGPSFRITNKSSSVILYGKIMVYFYDKAGKQLEVKEAGSSTPKPYLSCFGNMFGGVMKAGEKAVITFSCFKKELIPANAAAIEGEMQMVGFADASEKKSEYYWRNNDLTPDVRKKGGIK